MLLQLRDYIRVEKNTNVAHLARVFHTDVSVLKMMIERLVERGMLEPIESVGCHTKSCSGCR